MEKKELIRKIIVGVLLTASLVLFLTDAVKIAPEEDGMLFLIGGLSDSLSDLDYTLEDLDWLGAELIDDWEPEDAEDYDDTIDLNDIDFGDTDAEADNIEWEIIDGDLDPDDIEWEMDEDDIEWEMDEDDWELDEEWDDEEWDDEDWDDEEWDDEEWDDEEWDDEEWDDEEWDDEEWDDEDWEDWDDEDWEEELDEEELAFRSSPEYQKAVAALGVFKKDIPYLTGRKIGLIGICGKSWELRGVLSDLKGLGEEYMDLEMTDDAIKQLTIFGITSAALILVAVLLYALGMFMLIRGKNGSVFFTIYTVAVFAMFFALMGKINFDMMGMLFTDDQLYGVAMTVTYWVMLPCSILATVLGYVLGPKKEKKEKKEKSSETEEAGA